MNNLNLMRHTLIKLSLVMLFLVGFNSLAHDSSNMDEYAVDQTNNKIYRKILQIQEILFKFYTQEKKAEAWPDKEIILLKNELVHLKADAEMSIDFFYSKGLDLQKDDALKVNPLAGKSVNASRAIEVAEALLVRISNLENQGAFRNEMYTGGLVAFMYNLMVSYKEQIELYDSLNRLIVKDPLTGGD